MNTIIWHFTLDIKEHCWHKISKSKGSIFLLSESCYHIVETIYSILTVPKWNYHEAFLRAIIWILRQSHWRAFSIMKAWVVVYLWVVVFLLLFETQTNGLQVDMDCQDHDKCGEHGKCIKHMMSANESQNQCQCEETYTSIENPCDYKQKRQLTAFLLSLFLGPFGADWFYLAKDSTSYTFIGVTKLLLSFWLVSCCVAFCSTCIAGIAGGFKRDYKLMIKDNCRNTFCIPCGSNISCICVTIFNIYILGPFVWWIVDLARILAGTFRDGNGQDLLPF